MARTVFHGAQVFDGTGSEPYLADVAIEADRIVAVGPGLDGDRDVDVSGLTLLPGLFDAHVHVTLSGVDLWRIAQQPFSYQFYLAQQNLRSTLEAGIISVRDAGGADLGIAQAVDDGLIAGPRMRQDTRRPHPGCLEVRQPGGRRSIHRGLTANAAASAH